MDYLIGRDLASVGSNLSPLLSLIPLVSGLFLGAATMAAFAYAASKGTIWLLALSDFSNLYSLKTAAAWLLGWLSSMFLGGGLHELLCPAKAAKKAPFHRVLLVCYGLVHFLASFWAMLRWVEFLVLLSTTVVAAAWIVNDKLLSDKTEFIVLPLLFAFISAAGGSSCAHFIATGHDKTSTRTWTVVVSWLVGCFAVGNLVIDQAKLESWSLKSVNDVCMCLCVALWLFLFPLYAFPTDAKPSWLDTYLLFIGLLVLALFVSELDLLRKWSTAQRLHEEYIATQARHKHDMHKPDARLVRLFNQLGIDEYLPAFQYGNYTIADVRVLTEEQVSAMIPAGRCRKRLMQWIREQQQQQQQQQQQPQQHEDETDRDAPSQQAAKTERRSKKTD